MTNSEEGRAWAEQLVRRFGETAKRARGKRSAKWLADETARLGYPISPTVIAKLDSGHRGGVLSVPEMLVIAAALDLPPAMLLYSDYPDGLVDRLPGEPMSSEDAAYRLTEKAGRNDPNQVTESSPEADRLRDALELGAQRRSVRLGVVHAMRIASRATRELQKSDPEFESRAAKELLEAVVDSCGQMFKQIDDIEYRMRKAGLTVTDKADPEATLPLLPPAGFRFRPIPQPSTEGDDNHG